MKKFRLPPISPLAGTSIKNYLRNLQNGHVEKQYWLKVFLTGLLILISEPFQQWEKVTFHRRLKRQPSILSPVFIVGHWRSGTTFLHNLLCQSTSAAYINTYQSVFPENLSSKWLFKTFMKWNMPDNRPGDHLRLHTNLPQEDEFAMSNIIPFAYYRFFYFPRQYNRFYDESVRMKMPTKKKILKLGAKYI